MSTRLTATLLPCSVSSDTTDSVNPTMACFALQ